MKDTRNVFIVFYWCIVRAFYVKSDSEFKLIGWLDFEFDFFVSSFYLFSIAHKTASYTRWAWFDVCCWTKKLQNYRYFFYHTTHIFSSSTSSTCPPQPHHHFVISYKCTAERDIFYDFLAQEEIALLFGFFENWCFSLFLISFLSMSLFDCLYNDCRTAADLLCVEEISCLIYHFSFSLHLRLSP